jgi:hypothetical protein
MRLPPSPSLSLTGVLFLTAGAHALDQQGGEVEVWLHLEGTVGGERLGESLEMVGDVDGDGTPDLVVGRPFGSSGGFQFNGFVEVLSGVDGSLIHRWDGGADFEYLGSTLSARHDVDGDGVDDILIGTPDATVGVDPDAGKWMLQSGATGLTIHAASGSAADERLGSGVALVGDLDGDGRSEFLVGAAGASSGAGRVDLHDGDGFGNVLVGARLVDANGLVDSGSALLVGGRDGTVVMRADGEAALDNLGRAVTGGRDFDGDGHPDIAYSAPFADPQGVSLGGEVEVVRIRPVLTATATGVGAAAGGVVAFTMDFPLSEAGLPYLLLASRSGVGPTPYRGASIPLTNDSLFQSMVNNPPPVFSGTAGNLDAGGDAVATLTLTPGIAAGFVGSTVHFAALSLDLGSLPSVVSNVVALTILP